MTSSVVASCQPADCSNLYGHQNWGNIQKNGLQLKKWRQLYLTEQSQDEIQSVCVWSSRHGVWLAQDSPSLGGVLMTSCSECGPLTCSLIRHAEAQAQSDGLNQNPHVTKILGDSHEKHCLRSMGYLRAGGRWDVTFSGSPLSEHTAAR